MLFYFIKIFAVAMISIFSILLIFTSLWFVSFYMIFFALSYFLIIYKDSGFDSGMIDFEFDYEKSGLVGLIALIFTGLYYYLDITYLHIFS